MVAECVDKAFDLFVELKASAEQCDFPIIYACARQGWCTADADAIPTYLEGGGDRSLKALFDAILDLPSPKADADAELQLLVSNIAYSDYLGTLALGRLAAGKVKKGRSSCGTARRKMARPSRRSRRDPSAHLRRDEAGRSRRDPAG